jgi:hypothetical protein
MHRTGLKAENALTTSVPASNAASGPYPGGEISLQRPGIERHDMLPRVKLEIPSANSANYAMPRLHDGAGHLGESTNASMSLDEKDDRDNESTVSPTDEREGTAGPDDSQRSPSLEKKKMKRFR